MKKENWKNWLLRIKSYSFIMIVNKNTGEYKNLYRKDFKNSNEIELISSLLEKHKNYK